MSDDDVREFGYVPSVQPERGKRHKWADVIIAWAEGRAVQCRPITVEGGKDWGACGYGVPDFNAIHYEFRVAPEPKYLWVMRGKEMGDYCVTTDYYTEERVRKDPEYEPVMPIEETRRDE